ncbi:carboxylesterase/lipase family protein [Trinickia fusca]|uniref:carboxylesterase/lipase family protein n=1 Tax=Trinickia fusca TaxID=2419777 RepID=UPI001C7D05A6|nr:carboxylesterase/lipase family protein [Trinickia fusca]
MRRQPAFEHAEPPPLARLTAVVLPALAAASLTSALPRTAHGEPISIAAPAPRIELPAGRIEGSRAQVNGTRLHIFKGVPYAAAPVGASRWREPQPVERWAGIRDAKQFAPRCMQPQSFGDMRFRSASMSEDCLYLNVWTPARSTDEKLPVLVYFHGGGFQAGDGSEPRYDGANLAARGIVSVTVNYRLGVFGFLALPELAQGSPHGASGNYGLLDQVAALRWVRDNIARFGGDPQRVTIGGESAGSASVSAHMASPLSSGLFAHAIGESGAAFASGVPLQRRDAEKKGQAFLRQLSAPSLDALRNLPADTVQTASRDHESSSPEAALFWPHVDGYFLTEPPEATFRKGAQAQVPLLVGTNSHEADVSWLRDNRDLAPAKWRDLLTSIFDDRADEALTHYPGHNATEIANASSALAGDLLIDNGVWRWMNVHRETGHAPVYFYSYTHTRPPRQDTSPDTHPAAGAMQSSEIEYVFANLDREPSYAWTADDRQVSRLFSGYFLQFVKHGNPNGPTLPNWPAVREDQGGLLRQVIDTRTQTTVDRSAARQAFLESFFRVHSPVRKGDTAS